MPTYSDWTQAKTRKSRTLPNPTPNPRSHIAPNPYAAIRPPDDLPAASNNNAPPSVSPSPTPRRSLRQRKVPQRLSPTLKSRTTKHRAHFATTVDQLLDETILALQQLEPEFAPPSPVITEHCLHLQAHSWTDTTILAQLDDASKAWLQDALGVILPSEFALGAVHPDTGETVEYPALLKSSDGHLWVESCAEECGRLAQGYKNEKGTDTIKFIKITDIPHGRKATYLRLVASDRPNKAQTRRVRFTVGGDRIEYSGETSTKTAGLTTAKILFNSVLSTPKARFMTGDVKDFYLMTPMERKEYMRIPINIIPPQIIELYNLTPLIHNGFVYVEISKGMYGLPHAGRLANDALIIHLAANGYHQCEHTPGLFRHETRPIMFCLVVDDFGVQYVGREHAEHLMSVIGQKYKYTEDWSGTSYCGLTLDWDYENRTVDLSMPGYIANALQRFAHPPPTKPQDAPHRYAAPQYGVSQQLVDPPDTTAPLDPKEITTLQEIIGTLLYYGRAIDNTMLVALSSLAAAQSKGTQATTKAAAHLLNYAATHPEATIRYHASDMCLHIHSDASYMSEPNARSRAGGFFFLSSHPDSTPTPLLNGPVHVVSNILRNVMSSVAEAEVGALFHNGQEACPIRTALVEMGWPQPATPIQTDNSVAHGIANDSVKQRRSRAIDMRFYWIRDRVRQGQFRIHWQQGSDNLADYFTKHHAPAHHRQMRPLYLHTEHSRPTTTTTSSSLPPSTDKSRL